jgi:hypothetical protein
MGRISGLGVTKEWEKEQEKRIFHRNDYSLWPTTVALNDKALTNPLGYLIPLPN